MFSENIPYYTAFTAGLLSFLAPCVLPLIPAYFTFITGMSLDELTAADTSKARTKIILSTIAYVSGFSLIFVALGAAASSLGAIASEYSNYIRIIGGVLILIFGLHLLGILKYAPLQFEKRFHLTQKPLHFFGTFLVGMAFAAGWSPCISPLLGSILALAAQDGSITKGILLLSVYSAGMALPFILISIFIDSMLVFIRKANSIVRYINIVSGVMLIIIGIILLTDKINLFTFT